MENRTRKERREAGAKVKVVGIGQEGISAINHMIREGMGDVEFVCVNVDSEWTPECKSTQRVLIKRTEIHQGGAALRNDADLRLQLGEVLQGSDVVFVLAGLDSETGSVLAPYIAEVCRDHNELAIALATAAISPNRVIQDQDSLSILSVALGAEALTKSADSTILLPPQMQIEEDLAAGTMGYEDLALLIVRSVNELMTGDGPVSLDSRDIVATMKAMGRAIVGIGEAEGENRAVAAAKRAISLVRLRHGDISGTKGLLISITGGEDMTLYDVSDVTQTLYSAVGESPDTNIVFGAASESGMKGRIRVVFIAAGTRGADSSETDIVHTGEEPNGRPPVDSDASDSSVGDATELGRFKPLSLLVDTGTAPPEVIADILSDISVLYRLQGGSGIEFNLDRALVSTESRT